VQDASYLKLREVTLAYNLPENITRGLFGSSVRYCAAGCIGPEPGSLHRLSGLDPEVSNFGNQAIVRNVDVAPFPPTAVSTSR